MKAPAGNDKAAPGSVQGGHKIACFYDRDSAHYDLNRWTSAPGQRNLRTQSSIIGELNKEWKNKRILEVGVGTGRIATDIARKGSEVVGVDFSAGMLRACAEKLRTSQQKKVNLLRANGMSLPFADRSFDGCVCINVLSHVPDFRRVIAEISRVLKYRGFAIVNFPNLFSLYFPFGVLVNATRRSIKRDVFTKWYSPWKVKKAAESYGITLRRVAGQVHVPDGIPTLLSKKVLFTADKLLRSSALRWICPTLFFRFERNAKF